MRELVERPGVILGEATRGDCSVGDGLAEVVVEGEGEPVAEDVAVGLVVLDTAVELSKLQAEREKKMDINKTAMNNHKPELDTQVERPGLNLKVNFNFLQGRIDFSITISILIYLLVYNFNPIS
jgi:hypothetical protein